MYAIRARRNKNSPPIQVARTTAEKVAQMRACLRSKGWECSAIRILNGESRFK